MSGSGSGSTTGYFATSSPLWLSAAATGWVERYEIGCVRARPSTDRVLAQLSRLVAGRGGAVGGAEGAGRPRLLVGLVDDAADLPAPLRRVAERESVRSAPGASGHFVVQDEEGNLAVLGADEPGALYGALRLVVEGPEALPGAGRALSSTPAVALRMLNHWDNLEPHPVMGSIERGYSGDSLFWEHGALVEDLGRVEDYGLVLASLGINAVSLNNVNVHALERTLLTERLELVATLARILRPYHVRVYLAVGFDSPMALGGLATCDPLDESVIAWWEDAVARAYRAVPDLGGLVVKADSEGRPGPAAYGRDHAEGANMLAAALSPHGGTLLWRCFVYNHRQDWRDRALDRARAAHDHFMPLDGRFADNVVLQIKHGPLDFQVREPVSPLLLGLRRTRVALELQITQEYTGQQWDTCFLPTAWRELLDLDPADDGTELSAHLCARPGTAVVGVANVGRDHSWTGNVFSQANLYGFGRLAWDPRTPAEDIARRWAAATFGDHEVAEAAAEILLASYRAYENYTAPLGVGFMVSPGGHYGPCVDGYEYSPWGTYHFADREGVGVDRTPSGSGMTEQYPAALAERYRSIETCPERLLLFFHHLPYTQRLPQSGTTLIQRIYDTHFEGVEQVRAMRRRWEQVRHRVDARLHEDIDRRWSAQERNAVEWRDQVCTYFLRHSGVPDERGRTIFP